MGTAGWRFGMRFGRIVLGTLGAFAVVAAVACNGGNDNKFPDDLRKSFLETCTGSGSSSKQCECALEKLEGKYNTQQFRDLERRITSGDASAEAEIGPIASACRDA
jgi:hypothetical protein